MQEIDALLNPDCNPNFWNELWLSIQIGFWIWIVNPVFPFQSKSKKFKFFLRKLKFYGAFNQKKPSKFDA